MKKEITEKEKEKVLVLEYLNIANKEHRRLYRLSKKYEKLINGPGIREWHKFLLVAIKGRISEWKETKKTIREIRKKCKF